MPTCPLDGRFSVLAALLAVALLTVLPSRFFGCRRSRDGIFRCISIAELADILSAGLPNVAPAASRCGALAPRTLPSECCIDARGQTRRLTRAAQRCHLRQATVAQQELAQPPRLRPSRARKGTRGTRPAAPDGLPCAPGARKSPPGAARGRAAAAASVCAGGYCGRGVVRGRVRGVARSETPSAVQIRPAIDGRGGAGGLRRFARRPALRRLPSFASLGGIYAAQNCHEPSKLRASRPKPAGFPKAPPRPRWRMQAVLDAREARHAARANDAVPTAVSAPAPVPAPAPADARRARILKELAKLAFDHPGPVLAQDFVEDVTSRGQAYAPVVSTGKPAGSAKPAQRPFGQDFGILPRPFQYKTRPFAQRERSSAEICSR